MIEAHHIRLIGKKSFESEMVLQILGLQSINPPLQECLEIGTCFLEEQFDRHGNAPKYAVPSAAGSP